MIHLLAAGVDTEQLGTLGVPGLVVVVVVLAGVVIFLYKDGKSERNRNDTIQEQRLVEAKENRDRIGGQMEEQVKLSEKIYEILVGIRDRK